MLRNVENEFFKKHDASGDANLSNLVSVELVNLEEVADKGGDVALVISQDFLLFWNLVRNKLRGCRLLMMRSVILNTEVMDSVTR